MKRSRHKPRGKLAGIKKQFPKVEEVVDSNDSVRVSVFPRDCSSGRSKSPEECALARATKRQYKADGVIIGMTVSYVIRGRKAIRFATPQSVQREITSFDRHHDFEPGSYHLAPISPSQALGKKTGGTHTKGTALRKRSIVHRRTARVREL